MEILRRMLETQKEKIMKVETEIQLEELETDGGEDYFKWRKIQIRRLAQFNRRSNAIKFQLHHWVESDLRKSRLTKKQNAATALEKQKMSLESQKLRNERMKLTEEKERKVNEMFKQDIKELLGRDRFIELITSSRLKVEGEL